MCVFDNSGDDVFSQFEIVQSDRIDENQRLCSKSYIGKGTTMMSALEGSLVCLGMLISFISRPEPVSV